ncbi:PucR family transcriptional regulator [Nocardia nova]|uniref:PucR family transcriptional regulator n=1 Tax=Nocardia nova TaxID=37330 RepID=UPI003401BB75
MERNLDAATRVYLEYLIDLIEDQDPGDKVEQLHRAAADWARQGIPIDTVHHAVREGIRLAFDSVLAQRGRSTTGNEYAETVLRVADTIFPEIAAAYVKEHRLATEHDGAKHALASALLFKKPTAAIARESGIEISAAYTVLAVHMPGHNDSSPRGVNTVVAERRRLRRVRGELAILCGGRILPALGVCGGTILVPDEYGPHDQLELEIDVLVSALSASAGTAVTATAVTTPRLGIPDAAECAHELLDLALRLKRPPGLYWLSDLSAEYQVTRPGPGRDHLQTVLAPLSGYPDLLETLERHLANELVRQVTAHELHVHVNTLDYRLRRIGQLTGFNPAEPSGLWRLQAALVARTYLDPENRNDIPTLRHNNIHVP